MENKRLYPPFWQHDYHVLKRLYKVLRGLSEKIPAGSVIADYGCGASPYEQLFRRKYSRYIRIDIGKNPRADISILENRPLPLSKASVSLVLSTQVLEHVNNVPLYLSESARILKKGGMLILSTHGIWPYHPVPSDYIRFTARGLRSEIEKYGFRVKGFFSILGPFAAVSQLTMLLLAARLGGRNLFFRIFLAVLSLIGNFLIWLEDILFPPDKNSDASVFVVWAEKQ